MKDMLYIIANVSAFATMTSGKEFRVARWDAKKNKWSVFVGKRGGNLRRYKTLPPMDKALGALGYIRYE